MSDIMHERRRLLLSTAAWFGGLAALSAGSPVHAFQVGEMTPGSAVGRAYADRCGRSSDHTALIARLQGLLAEDPSEQSMTATCPLCGCPVVVTR